MHALKSLVQPRGVPEALALLAEHGERARLLAGGTSIVFSRSPRLEVLVDLSRAGLDEIRRDTEGLYLGAMVRMAALRRHLEPEPPTALLEAAAAVGSRVLQNHVTVGGNCVMAYAWSDLPVALRCLEASFVVQGTAGVRTIAADAFFAEHPARLLGSAEILVGVRLADPPVAAGSAYLKVGRNATDQALASAAAQVELTSGRIRRAVLVAGAVRPLPQALTTTASLLAGQTVDEELLARAGREATQEIQAAADFRASADFRRELAGTLVEDALRLALTRAGGAQ